MRKMFFRSLLRSKFMILLKKVTVKNIYPFSNLSIRYLSSKRYFEPYDLTFVQRTFLFPYFALGSLHDPKRGDLVAGLGDLTSITSLKKLHQEILKSDAGRQLLVDKPIISTNSLAIATLRSLPDNTLGRGYITYMDEHGFSPDERAIVRFIQDPDLAYIMVRYRQVHDFWHVLCNLQPTILGEIALKLFEWELTNLPICAMSGLFGQLKLSSEERSILKTVYHPWAKRAAKSSNNLLTFRYENYLDHNLNDLRKILNVEMAPTLP